MNGEVFGCRYVLFLLLFLRLINFSPSLTRCLLLPFNRAVLTAGVISSRMAQQIACVSSVLIIGLMHLCSALALKHLLFPYRCTSSFKKKKKRYFPVFRLKRIFLYTLTTHQFFILCLSPLSKKTAQAKMLFSFFLYFIGNVTSVSSTSVNLDPVYFLKLIIICCLAQLTHLKLFLSDGVFL